MLISSAKLFEAINGLFPGESGKMTEIEKNGPTVDRQSLLKAFDHDWSLFKELVDIFTADTPQMISELRKSAGEQDADTLNRTAHSFAFNRHWSRQDTMASCRSELKSPGPINTTSWRLSPTELSEPSSCCGSSKSARMVDTTSGGHYSHAPAEG